VVFISGLALGWLRSVLSMLLWGVRKMGVQPQEEFLRW
jgi:hypothetical protein